MINGNIQSYSSAYNMNLNWSLAKIWRKNTISISINDLPFLVDFVANLSGREKSLKEFTRYALVTKAGFLKLEKNTVNVDADLLSTFANDGCFKLDSLDSISILHSWDKFSFKL